MISALFDFLGRRRAATPAPEPPKLHRRLRIGQQEQPLFRRAVQLYIFVHHVGHNQLSGELHEQFQHTGNAVYSLLINWLRDGKPSLEYMDFLNEKLGELRALPEEELRRQGIQILPGEISLLELQSEVRLRFQDEDREDGYYYLRYLPEEGFCEHNVEKAQQKA